MQSFNRIAAAFLVLCVGLGFGGLPAVQAGTTAEGDAATFRADGDVVLEPNFGTGPYSPVTTNSRVTGKLPEGWEDDSAWAQVWMKVGPQTEENVKFFRLDQTKREYGRGVIRHPLPDIRKETFFRLRLRARSRTNTPVQIQLRMIPYPWTSSWNTVPNLGSHWRTYTYKFRVGPQKQKSGLFISLLGEGRFDLASLRLERLSRKEWIDELRRCHPGGAPRNLLRNTRFPLGMQSGWSMDRDMSDGDEVIVESDPQTIGPSGSPAMRLKPAGARWIQMPPFKPVWPFEKYTASLYVKGNGEGALAVLGDGRMLGKTSFQVKAGEPWQRIAVSFQPVMVASVHWMRIEDGRGEFWIDAAQVNRGNAPTNYTPQMQAEVAIAVPAACEAAPARVQFEDEPAKLDFAVTGAPAGSYLHTKVLNVYGDAQMLEPKPLKGIFLEQMPLEYDVFPQAPFGPFRVEAWIVDAAGERISPYNELVVHRLRRPRYWGKDAPNSPFGVHTLPARRHLLMAKAIGMNWVRLHGAGASCIAWCYLEPKPNQWTFRDDTLQRYRKHHLKILATLSAIPEWARHKSNWPAGGGRYSQPCDLKQYAKYVRTVVKRYRGVIDAWEAWNEPWMRSWAVGYDPVQGMIPSDNPARDYVDLLQTVYETVKSVDPDAKVLGINTTGGTLGSGRYSGEEWTRLVVENNGLAYCDDIAYHQYLAAVTGFPGDEVEQGYRRGLGPILNAKGLVPKPVWMTEGETVSLYILGNGFYHHTLTYEDDENVMKTVNRTCRFVLSLLGQGVQKVFLYSMHCHYFFTQGRSAYRSLVTDEGYLHPVASAFSTLAWHLEDTRHQKTVQVAPGVYAYCFTGPRGKVAVLSRDPKRHDDYLLPNSDQYEIRDLFGNPVSAGSKLGDELVYITIKPGGNLNALLVSGKP
jgi:hypothetical protein